MEVRLLFFKKGEKIISYLFSGVGKIGWFFCYVVEVVKEIFIKNY